MEVLFEPGFRLPKLQQGPCEHAVRDTQAESDAPALPRKESTGKQAATFGSCQRCTLARTLRGWC